jgi:hypothetical protein
MAVLKERIMSRSVIVALVAFAAIATAAMVFALTGGAQILRFWPLESAADFVLNYRKKEVDP